MGSVLKIVVTGPESTGKSAICRKLAEEFGVIHVPEFARIYLEKEGPEYDFDLVSKMARLHLEFQQEYIHKADGIIILDTDLINYQVWQEVVFGKVDPWIKEQITKESEHRYLLTFPDIPWQEDPLRSPETDRESIYRRHLTEIEQKGRSFEIVDGSGEVRFLNAASAFLKLTRSEPQV